MLYEKIESYFTTLAHSEEEYIEDNTDLLLPTSCIKNTFPTWSIYNKIQGKLIFYPVPYDICSTILFATMDLYPQ
jgi:hypothetical protein